MNNFTNMNQTYAQQWFNMKFMHVGEKPFEISDLNLPLECELSIGTQMCIFHTYKSEQYYTIAKPFL